MRRSFGRFPFNPDPTSHTTCPTWCPLLAAHAVNRAPARRPERGRLGDDDPVPAAPARPQQGPAPTSPPESVWRPRRRRPQQQGAVPARPRTVQGNSADDEPVLAQLEPDGREQEPDGPEQEPGPARRPPRPGDPGDQEPGGFRPF